MNKSGLDQTAVAIVLAAGRGTRMNSDQPKVVHTLNGRPMITHVLDALRSAGFDGLLRPAPVIVVGFGGDAVQHVVGARASYVEQTRQQGTGDAARVGMSAVPDSARRVLIVHGDEPLIDGATYQHMLELQQKSGVGIVLLTGKVDDTQSLGRVIRDSSGAILRVKQEKELTAHERTSREINFGAYVFSRAVLDGFLAQLEDHPGGELYLTDLIGLSAEHGLGVDSVSVRDPESRMGVNDPAQLRRAERFMNQAGV